MKRIELRNRQRLGQNAAQKASCRVMSAALFIHLSLFHTKLLYLPSCWRTSQRCRLGVIHTLLSHLSVFLWFLTAIESKFWTVSGAPAYFYTFQMFLFCFRHFQSKKSVRNIFPFPHSCHFCLSLTSSLFLHSQQTPEQTTTYVKIIGNQCSVV